MRTFTEFVSLVEKAQYDPEVGQSIQRVAGGEGGRVGRDRRKSAPERRRMKQAKAGETRQPSEYKPRKDIGTQKKTETRVQQPESERGSAREAQLAAAKAERKKAAQARIAAKKSGESATESKPKAKEVEKQASKLLSKKKSADVDKRPADQPKRPVVGMSRAERARITKKGQRLLRDLVLQATGKKKESELKHRYTTW